MKQPTAQINGRGTMYAAVLRSLGSIALRRIPRPKLEPGHVLVRVRAAGICGSEIGKVFGGDAHHYPMVLGHELAGEVAEVAPDVTITAPGQRVVGIPLLPCFRCDRCSRGEYFWCRAYGFVGARSFGAFAEYVSLPEDNVLQIPEALSWEQAALVEPATVALHNIERCCVRPGQRIVVFGAGTVGLLIIAWLRMMGIDDIIAVDVMPEKLSMAEDLGASATLLAPERDPVHGILELTDADGAEVTFETSGSPVAVEQAIQASRPRATIVQIGFLSSDLNLARRSFDLIARKELNLAGSSMSYSLPFPGHEWTVTLTKCSSGEFPPAQLITHRFPLSEAEQAFDLVASGDKFHLKIVLLP